MWKKLFSVLLVLSMCLCMTGVTALADEEDDEVTDYTSGVTLACNGDVVTKTIQSYLENDELWEEFTCFYVGMYLEELDTFTLELLDSNGNAAADTVVSAIEFDDYDASSFAFAGTISGNVVTVTGQFGYVYFKVSSASLDASTYVLVEYFSEDFVEDLTTNAIVYCNSVEITSYTYYVEMNIVEKLYYVEMAVGSTYELQFVDPTTGDVLSLDDYDWLEDVDGVTVNGNIVTVTPTETGEVWIIGPAGVIVSYVSADAETTSDPEVAMTAVDADGNEIPVYASEEAAEAAGLTDGYLVITSTTETVDLSDSDIAAIIEAEIATNSDATADTMEVLTVVEVYYVGEGTPSFPLTLTFTVDGLTADNFIAVLHKVDGSWIAEEAYVDADGNVVVTVNSLSPFAFIISSTASEDETTTASTEAATTSTVKASSETADTSVWGYVLLLAGAAVVIAVLAKKHADA